MNTTLLTVLCTLSFLGGAYWTYRIIDFCKRSKKYFAELDRRVEAERRTKRYVDKLSAENERLSTVLPPVFPHKHENTEMYLYYKQYKRNLITSAQAYSAATEYIIGLYRINKLTLEEKQAFIELFMIGLDGVNPDTVEAEFDAFVKYYEVIL